MNFRFLELALGDGGRHRDERDASAGKFSDLVKLFGAGDPPESDETVGRRRRQQQDVVDVDDGCRDDFRSVQLFDAESFERRRAAVGDVINGVAAAAAAATQHLVELNLAVEVSDEDLVLVTGRARFRLVQGAADAGEAERVRQLSRRLEEEDRGEVLVADG